MIKKSKETLAAVSITPMSESVCKNCKHWRKIDSQYGSCHALPPTVSLRVNVTPYGLGGVWPVTPASEYCGVFIRPLTL